MYINQTCLPENYSNMFFMELYKRFPETFIIAEKDGQIVGYVMCRVEGGFSGLGFRRFGARKGHVISVAVLPEYRKRGVGSALMKEVLQAMSTHYEAESCYLEVRASNTSAINLYKKAGFEVERKIRGYYSDGEAALMMRPTEIEPERFPK
jgi:ribosomal-protein-alanine N-acetyltransferase